MELRQLRYFLAVLEAGSINRAAATLKVTQPSLSYSIKALERSIGAELLIRSGGGVSMTRIGQEFAKYAQYVVREVEKAKEQVAQMQGGTGGRITIGVLSVFSASFLPQVLSTCLADPASPDLDVRIFTLRWDEIAERLRRAEWDMALTLIGKPSTYPDDIGVESLHAMTSSAYCSAAHPLARMKSVSLAELCTKDWVITNIGQADQMLNAAFAEAGAAAAKIRMRTDSMDLILALVSDGAFICMAPDDMVADDVKSGLLVKIDQNYLGSVSNAAVIYSKVANQTKGLKTLIDVIRAQSAIFAGTAP